MWRFIKAYIKSMRLYYAFVTGICGWLGLAYYEYLAGLPQTGVEVQPPLATKGMILLLFFLSWGINQIINDYLGLPEDRINAPQRPMVTGELHPQLAVLVSAILLLLTAGVIWFFLEPVALWPMLVGVLLNVLYEYAKGYGILGNLVFGVMIAMCAVFGFLAAGPVSAPYVTGERVALFGLLVVLNAVMTFYTYFKDYAGDKAANKRTVVVKYGLQTSRFFALAAAVLPALTFLTFCGLGWIAVPLTGEFVFLGVLTTFLHVQTGYRYYRHPSGEETYYSLKVNFQAASCGQAALIALINPQLGMMLFIATYILVGVLFDLYSNSKA